MNINQIMQRNLITLELDDSLESAKKLFEKHHMHHILIKDQTTLAGVITDRDLWKHLSPTVGTRKETPQDSFILNKKVHLIMVRDLITATENISLTEAVLLFHDHKISCLPVVDENKCAIGIITWRDIIKVMAVQYRRKNPDNVK
ncbi:CBS domain-containing protein [Colwellia sp. C1TZA3]|uniref:CBS domain-containing protein n=1 Tax=Colwellia sp. C1TZA3 TaxID=2508879 RepID=UPI00174CB22F|nr:CBS domain-containing protein [Colwellia sp. C1TZA3]